MQLYDKDLLSMQEVRELVGAAKKAQQELAGMTQEQVDRIVRAIADAGVRNARRLAEMANEDTGFGKVEDKVIKNVFGSRGVYEYIKDMKTVGELERDEVNKTRTIAVPVGVIAGLIPSTNPTSTALYKSEIAIKAGNAIVFSPHPTALRCIMETVKVIRQAISEAGGNENLVSCITIPTMEATDNLMRHRDVALILATGGSAMVRAAYSSGTPAIGVGPGNGPAYLEKTCACRSRSSASWIPRPLTGVRSAPPSSPLSATRIWRLRCRPKWKSRAPTSSTTRSAPSSANSFSAPTAR